MLSGGLTPIIRSPSRNAQRRGRRARRVYHGAMETPSTQGGRSTGCCVVLMMKSAARSKRRLAEHIGAQRATQAAQCLARLRLRGPCGVARPRVRRALCRRRTHRRVTGRRRRGAARRQPRRAHQSRERRSSSGAASSGSCSSASIARPRRRVPRARGRRARRSRHACSARPPTAAWCSWACAVVGPRSAALPWSTSALFESLRAACAARGSSAATLPRLHDVDTLGDLLALRTELLGDARPARRALVRWLTAQTDLGR